MNERTLSKTQFLIEGDENSPVIRTFRRRRTTALFTREGKFIRPMDWREFDKLSETDRLAHTIQTIWLLSPNQD